MKPSLALAALLSALACAGCSSLPREGVQVALSQPFTLRPGERASLPQQASLRYVGVESDSRCPPQVQCVWAGDARVNLAFEQAGAVTDLALDMSSTRPQPVGPWMLHLLQLDRGAKPALTLRLDAAADDAHRTSPSP